MQVDRSQPQRSRGERDWTGGYRRRFVAKVAAANRARGPRSAETRAKISAAKLGRKVGPYPQASCCVCHRQVAVRNMGVHLGTHRAF